jgi:YHS domain-containing protein
MKTLLLVLLGIAGVATTGCDRRESRPASTDPSARVKDPVCGMMVDPAHAAKDHTYQGVKYSFCSSECHDKFKDSPATYVQR